MARRVLVFCAHSDDQSFGAGGFIAKLSSEGAKVRTIVCSFGEQSHPHLKPEEVRPTRVDESQKADKILGGNGVMFIGLKEGKFIEDFHERNLLEKLSKVVKEYKPDLILTHAIDDPHPDHRAVLQILLEIHDNAQLTCEVFSFEVWNFANILKRRAPILVVDVTKTFHRKVRSLEVFKSQISSLIMLLWSVYVKAFYWGLRNRTRYAEAYYKVR